MFHYQNDQNGMQIAQYPAPDYPGTPICCNQDMLMFSLDEWIGEGLLTFFCPECGAWVVK